MVTVKQLRELYHARPFKPFVLVLASGERVIIPEPVRFGIAEELGVVMYAANEGGVDTAPFDAVTVDAIKPPKARRKKAS